MKNLLLILLALFTILALTPTVADTKQDTPDPSGPPPGFMVKPPVPIDPPDKDMIPLSGSVANDEQWEVFFTDYMVRNVKQAGLYPVFRAKSGELKKPILVVPGGGYNFVAMENEGFPVAERLAREGYAPFVLKYRTFKTSRKPDLFIKEVSAAFRKLGKEPLPDHPPAVDDLAKAIVYLQDNCRELGCDPDAIGAVGFSAGARTLIRALENKAETEALAHVSLMYPPIGVAVKKGPRPPLFLAVAADDVLFKQRRLTLVEHWLAESANMEFHLYANGGHGFGTRSTDKTASTWLDQYLVWLSRAVFLK